MARLLFYEYTLTAMESVAAGVGYRLLKPKKLALDGLGDENRLLRPEINSGNAMFAPAIFARMLL